ncbi:Cytochrome P450 6k1 [Cryptotermes secundus]|uniref:Cytochrome P450 6k1 n=1 Tax=Cryptotermes secundus TaxID=105785 RepID=A0A2J7R4Q7_9NEOP|nr:Cytochrome P450 6k1 [Cryptotermes secundus]
MITCLLVRQKACWKCGVHDSRFLDPAYNTAETLVFTSKLRVLPKIIAQIILSRVGILLTSMGFLSDSLLLDVGILVACVLSVVYSYFNCSFTYWKKRNVPYVEPCFPFGNFKEVTLMRKDFGYLIRDIYSRFEGHRYGGMYIFDKPQLFPRDPDLIKDVLVKDFSNFHDRGVYMNEEIEPLSGHLFSLPGKRWRNLRIKLSPTFTSGKMKMMFQRFVECGDELKLCLENVAGRGEVIEVKDILDVTKYFRKMVEETVEYREMNKVKRNDFMQLLIQLKQKGSLDSEQGAEDRSDEEFSGIDETADASMCIYFHETGLNTDIFNLLNIRFNFTDHTTRFLFTVTLHVSTSRAKEFLTVFSVNSATPFHCLLLANVLERISRPICEPFYATKTLRKYPPLPTISRKSSKPYKIPETDIDLDTGTSVIIPVIGLHHDPKYYPDPDRFDPERFSEEEKQKRHHYVYLPFGEGPRICIGMRFGLMQTKVGLVSLLSKYQFSVSKKTPVPLVFDAKSFILAPVGGMWLKIKNRSMK